MSLTSAQPPLLGGRYVETEPRDAGDLQLMGGYDEVLRRHVTLLLMAHDSSLSEQLALRLQLRRTSTVVDPGLAQVLDVGAGAGGLVVVVAYLGDARLLSQAGRLPAGGAAVLRDALASLHAHGSTHGAISASAVAVTNHGRVVLLPAPTRVAAQPEEDLTALDRLIAAYPEDPRSLPVDPPASDSVDTILLPTATNPDRVVRSPIDHTSVNPAPTAMEKPHSVVARGSVVLCGGFAGALLADLVLRLLS